MSISQNIGRFFREEKLKQVLLIPILQFTINDIKLKSEILFDFVNS